MSRRLFLVPAGDLQAAGHEVTIRSSGSGAHRGVMPQWSRTATTTALPRAHSHGSPVSRLWHRALVDFADFQRAAGRSPGTIRLYAYRLTDLAGTVPGPGDVSTEHLIRLLGDPSWAPETRKSVRSAWRSFFRWAVQTGRVESDPTIGLPTITVPEPIPRPAPEHVVRAALQLDDERLVLMVLLAAYGGLRACEVAAVHSRDLAGDVLNVVGKGGKHRVVPVSGDLLERLQRVQGWAFPSPLGGHITPGHVSRLLSRALPDGWTAHTLRHRMATTAYAGTGDLLAVQRLLGHSRPETTQRYVLLPDDRLRAAAAAASTAA